MWSAIQITLGELKNACGEWPGECLGRGSREIPIVQLLNKTGEECGETSDLDREKQGKESNHTDSRDRFRFDPSRGNFVKDACEAIAKKNGRKP
jgi:hypothetical protein